MHQTGVALHCESCLAHPCDAQIAGDQQPVSDQQSQLMEVTQMLVQICFSKKTFLAVSA